jgi:CRP/FNR family transcriptional regulator, cyclic AMP receptor protein
LAGISLPVLTVKPGSPDLGALLAEHRAFGAAVIDGVLVASLHVEGQAGIHLLGRGDLLVPGSEIWPAWLAPIELRAAAPVTLGMLGTELLAVTHRWPRIVPGLYEAMGDQLRRLTAQLVICQLPRVEDRITSMLWLLAESWGHVTLGGVRVPLALTHETLGALIGSRRPIVSLALRKLTEEGTLVPQDSGWLLLGDEPEPAEPDVPVGPVQLADSGPGRWAPAGSIAYAELRDTVRLLREKHRSNAQRMHDQLSQVRADRARMMTLRDRIARDAVKRRHPPSS